MYTGHTFGDVFSADGWSAPAWPLLVLGLSMIILLCFQDLIEKGIVKCMPSWKVGDMDLNEELDTYWNSLDDHDRRWSKGEESHFREMDKIDFSNLGVPKGKKYQMMSNNAYEDL